MNYNLTTTAINSIENAKHYLAETDYRLATIIVREALEVLNDSNGRNGNQLTPEQEYQIEALLVTDLPEILETYLQLKNTNNVTPEARTVLTESLNTIRNSIQIVNDSIEKEIIKTMETRTAHIYNRLSVFKNKKGKA